MSRITESIKGLKAERRQKARELRQIDRLLSQFENLTETRPGKVKATNKPRKSRSTPKSRPRARNNVILTSKTTTKTAPGASFATSAI